MNQVYFWEGMPHDVKRYIQICPVCHEFKDTTQKIIPPLTELALVHESWHTVVSDTVRELPSSGNGYKHLVCVIDQYSK